LALQQVAGKHRHAGVPTTVVVQGWKKTGKLDSACDPQRSMLYAQQ